MLSCSCEFEPEVDEPYYWNPSDFTTFKKLRRKRCVSCKELIQQQAVCLEFRWEKTDYDGNEIQLASKFMCEECGEKFLNLTALGYCIDLGASMEYHMQEYRALTGFKTQGD